MSRNNNFPKKQKALTLNPFDFTPIIKYAVHAMPDPENPIDECNGKYKMKVVYLFKDGIPSNCFNKQSHIVNFDLGLIQAGSEGRINIIEYYCCSRCPFFEYDMHKDGEILRVRLSCVAKPKELFFNIKS